MVPRPIAYLYPKRFFFVAKDIEGLAKRRPVLEHGFIHGPAWMLPFDLLAQFLFLMKARRKGVEQVFAHFAGFHTVLPALLGFKLFIIVAGSDACSFPGINYGSFRKPFMRWAMALSARRAKALLPVHAALEKFENTYSDVGPVLQGYAHFIKDLRSPTLPIPYGFDTAAWDFDGSAPRDARSALCVAFGTAAENAVHFRKGIDLIIEAARSLHDHRFTIVGAEAPATYAPAPPNVRILGRVSPMELKDLLVAHSIYLQPSIMEGFPNALCEAMLCGCLPIVSNITSMPSIVGDAGIVLLRRDADELARVLRTMVERHSSTLDELRLKARARVTGFTLSARIDALDRSLEGVTDAGGSAVH